MSLTALIFTCFFVFFGIAHEWSGIVFKRPRNCTCSSFLPPRNCGGALFHGVLHCPHRSAVAQRALPRAPAVQGHGPALVRNRFNMAHCPWGSSKPRTLTDGLSEFCYRRRTRANSLARTPEASSEGRWGDVGEDWELFYLFLLECSWLCHW